jgi:hypothetical protein
MAKNYDMYSDDKSEAWVVKVKEAEKSGFGVVVAVVSLATAIFVLFLLKRISNR